MTADTLSDVLRLVRLRGALFFYVTGSNQWVAEAPPAGDIAGAVMPGSEHVMEYHVVVAGNCWAGLVGEAPVRLSAGDVLVFPHGDGHVMSSAPGLRADPLVSWYHEMVLDALPLRVAYDGTSPPSLEPPRGEPATTLVCGFLGCDMRPFNPLVATLPRMLMIRGSEGGEWIAQLMRHAVSESAARRPGADAMLSRMSEMMFVEAVRRYVDSLPEGSAGWLAGLRDRYVGRALALLHARPSDPWTVETLGSQVGLSRSALHERFVRLVGHAPMQYLTSWRMQLASGLLRNTNSTVASIALEVGYDSEAAFARAFKRTVGAPPAAWRRGLRDARPRPREYAGLDRPMGPLHQCAHFAPRIQNGWGRGCPK